MTSGEQLSILQKVKGLENFEEKLKAAEMSPLRASKINIFQMNVGKRCNLHCLHCHVEAGSDRKEVMSLEIFEKCRDILKNAASISTIDITGGAPEMNPHLEWFIREVSGLNKRLIVRSNLVILRDDKYSKFIDIYAEHGVEIVTSMPYFSSSKTDRQRGKGVFEELIKILRILNAKGYGKEGRGLVLDLVHNPTGAYLPGSQSALEKEYKKKLGEEYGIVFNRLFSITNMPVGRYLEYLLKSDNYIDYFHDLENQYNALTLPDVMCRTTISVGWDGGLYDCDFNQMLGLTVADSEVDHIDNFDVEKLSGREIVIRNHCYGCTAGAGSSCQGCFE